MIDLIYVPGMPGISELADHKKGALEQMNKLLSSIQFSHCPEEVAKDVFTHKVAQQACSEIIAALLVAVAFQFHRRVWSKEKLKTGLIIIVLAILFRERLRQLVQSSAERLAEQILTKQQATVSLGMVDPHEYKIILMAHSLGTWIVDQALTRLDATSKQNIVVIGIGGLKINTAQCAADSGSWVIDGDLAAFFLSCLALRTMGKLLPPAASCDYCHKIDDYQRLPEVQEALSNALMTTDVNELSPYSSNYSPLSMQRELPDQHISLVNGLGLAYSRLY